MCGREELLQRLAARSCVPAAIAAAQPRDSITVVSWGGPYEHSQRKAYFEPFTDSTGVAIEVEQYNGGIEELREQVRSGNLAGI